MYLLAWLIIFAWIIGFIIVIYSRKKATKKKTKTIYNEIHLPRQFEINICFSEKDKNKDK
ncbi:MAG: hypothetical protein PHY08_07200 [Candidatus Cloacimonetes bacterium]|nr:hypothetical protein [Candidatus Cloacimonadota bacterium]MDD4156346.1 hypothetical protein [Candidatus Cloacimonadota bacterium]